MGRGQGGVRARGQSIVLDFYYQGMRCRETVKLEPTKANVLHVERWKGQILREIALGLFDYAKHFPESTLARRFSKTTRKTVSQALDEFLQAGRRTLEASTWRNYRSAVEHHLKPAFGRILLQDLTTANIKAWIGGLESRISNKRINNVLIPLRSIFDDAFGDELIDRNPTARIKNLTVRQEDPEPFTPAERSAILKELPDQAANLVEFALWTGLRTSELIALEWGDIDWGLGVVRVRRAWVEKAAKQTKTTSGMRDVMLLPAAVDALQRQKSFTFLAGGRVFHNPRTNTPWETDAQIRKTAWTPALRRAGVAYRNPYQTRHTYASTLLTAGEDPMWVAQQMGHKDWGMIRKRYGRWIPEVDNSAGSKVMALWSQVGHKVVVSD